MDSQLEIQTTSIYMLEEMEYEDDVFYSELRKQVLQLTAEDDDQELVYGNKNLSMVAVRKGGLHDGSRRDGAYYDWPQNEEGIAAPAWIMNLWKTGNGTGVFIPQIVHTTKKKNRPSMYSLYEL